MNVAKLLQDSPSQDRQSVQSTTTTTKWLPSTSTPPTPTHTPSSSIPPLSTLQHTSSSPQHTHPRSTTSNTSTHPRQPGTTPIAASPPTRPASNAVAPWGPTPIPGSASLHHHHHQHHFPPHLQQPQQQQRNIVASATEWQERESRDRDRERDRSRNNNTLSSTPSSTMPTSNSSSLLGPGSAIPSEEQQTQSRSHSISHSSTPIHTHPHTPGPGLSHRRLSGPDRDRDFSLRERERERDRDRQPPYFAPPPHPREESRDRERDRDRERERGRSGDLPLPFAREDTRPSPKVSRDDHAFPTSRGGLPRDQPPPPPRERPQGDAPPAGSSAQQQQQGGEFERILPGPAVIGGGVSASVSRSPEVAFREREMEMERTHRSSSSGIPPGVGGSPSTGRKSREEYSERDRERDREPLPNPHPFLHPHAHTHSHHPLHGHHPKHGSASAPGPSPHPSHSHTHPHSHSHHPHPVVSHSHYHHHHHGQPSRTHNPPPQATHGRKDQSLGAPISGPGPGSSEREKESPALSASGRERDRDRERERDRELPDGPGPRGAAKVGSTTPIPMSIPPSGSGGSIPPPQASYQHRFHTQFVTSGMGGDRAGGSSRPGTPREREDAQRRLSGGRERERERERFRERERERERRDETGYPPDHYGVRYAPPPPPPPHLAHGYSPLPHGHHYNHHNLPPPPPPGLSTQGSQAHHGMYPPPPPGVVATTSGHPHPHGQHPPNADMIVDPHLPPPLLHSGPPIPPHGHLQYDGHHPHPHVRAAGPPAPGTPHPHAQQQQSAYGILPVVPPGGAGYHSGPVVAAMPPPHGGGHGEYPAATVVASSGSGMQQQGYGGHLHGHHGGQGHYVAPHGHVPHSREREREKEREVEMEALGHRHSQHHQHVHSMHHEMRLGDVGHQPPPPHGIEEGWYAGGEVGYLHEREHKRERVGDVDRDRDRARERERERDREREREREQEAQRVQQMGIAAQRQQMQIYQHQPVLSHPPHQVHQPSTPGPSHQPQHPHHREQPRQQQQEQQQQEENQPGAAPQSLQPLEFGDYMTVLEEEGVIGAGTAVAPSTGGGGVGITPLSTTLDDGVGVGRGGHMMNLSLSAYVSPFAATAEWEEEKNRSKVKVELGTWVYPNVPFPYFFDLGAGLVGMKEREEERERRERERLEREKEFLERERDRKERRERERREREDRERVKREREREEGEIVEDEKEREKEKVKERDEVKPQSEPSLLTQPVPALPSALMPDSAQSMVDMETRVSIIIPTGFIPAEKPLRPQLWGGGAFAPGRPPRPTPDAKSIPRHHRHTSSRGINALTGLHVLAGSRRSRKTRRVYTDDSDVFLCAIHAGWITWSGAWKAKERGRDVRVDLRVVRVAGAGTSNIFARGVGGYHCKERDGGLGVYEGGDPEMVREEMIGRFTGGFGERCFNELGKFGRMVGEEGEEENFGWDDPEDDGRSLVSGGWGTGHDGSAIEIINVQFVEHGTAHKGPGLGRRNRSQRLLEYAERRAAVLATPSVCLAGRKRPRSSRARHWIVPLGRRPWDSNWPMHPRRAAVPYYNKSVLEIVYEEEGEGELVQKVDVDERREKEKRMMDVRTVVMGCGTADMKVGFKYLPSLVEDILFPSVEPTTTARSSTQRPRKRRRLGSEVETATVEDAEMEDVTTRPAKEELQLGKRPVILETAKESYLLSPSTPAGEGETRQMYDIALILEEAEEVVEEDVGPVDHLGGAEREGEGGDRDKTPVPGQSKFESAAATRKDGDLLEPPVEMTKMVGATRSPVHSPEPADALDPPKPGPPLTTSTSGMIVEEAEVVVERAHDDVVESLKTSAPLEASGGPPRFALQVLQRGLVKEMFRFEDEGVYVLDPGASVGVGAGGTETEWVIQVKSWKWVPGAA